MRLLGRLFGRDDGEQRAEGEDDGHDGEMPEQRRDREQVTRDRADLLRRQQDARLRLLRLEAELKLRGGAETRERL